MLFSTGLLLASSAALSVSASPIRDFSPALRNSKRDAAIRDSPSGTYAPSNVLCPAGLSVRIPVNGSLDPQEAAYVLEKTANSVNTWTEYLNNLGLAGLDVGSFVPSKDNAKPGVTLPNIGIAVSGGGERAMLVGGGILAALDGRNATTVAAKTGGILQLAQYLVGLSGGSWMTGSYALANFPSFESLRDEVWDLDQFLFGPELDNPTVGQDAVLSTTVKAAAGFPVSVVDPYGRFLAYHLVNDTGNPNGPGAATLWSSIKDTPAFVNRTAPFPIIISLGREAGTINVTIASPIYEITPYEFAVNNPTVSAAVPIQYLGTNLTNGKPVNPLLCVEGFENAAWLMGCSGNIFGATAQIGESAVTQLDLSNNTALNSLLGQVPDNEVTTGRVANPFFGLDSATYPSSEEKDLYLVDGGLAGENVPFFPLIQPQRALDVIIAVDASADTNNFPDGQEIFHTYEKSLQPGYAPFAPFPVIPNPVEFVALGLNSRPVFFGSSCTKTEPKTPLIVYLPNYNINYATNTSTSNPTYTPEAQQSFFDNSFAIATQTNGTSTNATESASWVKCLGCALVDAQVARNGVIRSAECEKCFSQWCHIPAM